MHTTDPEPLNLHATGGGGLAGELVENDEVQCTRAVAGKGAAGAGEPLTITTSCFAYEPLLPPETSESSNLQPSPTPEATPPSPPPTSANTATTATTVDSDPAPPPVTDAQDNSGPSITFSAEQAQAKTAAAEAQAAIETE